MPSKMMKYPCASFEDAVKRVRHSYCNDIYEKLIITTVNNSQITTPLCGPCFDNYTKNKDIKELC